MANLYVNKNNLKFNIKNIKAKLKENTNIIALVKANAYGCGYKEIVKVLLENGINDFGVALVSEGISLRNSFPEANILVTSQFLEEDIDDIIKNNLMVSVSNIELCGKLNEIAEKQNKMVNIHIKVDTGMTRLGFDAKKAVEKALYIKNNFKNINIKGVYTHLSSADSDPIYTKEQLKTFDDVVNSLKDNGIIPEYIHALNSAGAMCFNDYNYTHVRVGIALYGYYPDESLKQYIELKPILRLTAKIINIRDLTHDASISYNRTYLANKGSKIATMQIGYADGLKRSLSNKYSVLVNGVKCPIVGNICMDMCMINISKVENIKLGDEVIIFESSNDIDEIATIEGTINYEIMATIGSRVKRIYVD